MAATLASCVAFWAILASFAAVALALSRAGLLEAHDGGEVALLGCIWIGEGNVWVSNIADSPHLYS